MYGGVHRYTSRVPGPPQRISVSYAAFDVVVVAASAGGVKALRSLLGSLPSDFPVPIVLVQHLPPSSRYVSELPAVLQRKTPLRVKWAEDGEIPVPGTVYVAAQDRKTVFAEETGCFAVTHTPGQAFPKPNADALFLSAAAVFGGRTVAVVLSGALRDGAVGAEAIAAAGGRVLAQAASEAEFFDMPFAAMNRSQVGPALGTAGLARTLVGLVMMPGVAAWFGIGKAGVGAGLLAE